MLKKLLLFFLFLDLVFLAGMYRWQCYARAHPLRTNGEEVELKLKRGSFVVFNFAPKTSPPKALITLGSGDGGWGPWEETVSQALRQHGYQVIGIDSADYARSDYDLPTLQADFQKITQHFSQAYAIKPPLVIGGWSMGAAQAIAIAGGPQPPSDIVGLVLASPLSRGRYGLRLSDKLNILPTGQGTFAVASFAPAMSHLRIAQWHGEHDVIDSRAWLRNLSDPHREYDLANAGHDYNGACRPFLTEFLGSVDWVLNPPHQELNARND